MSKRRPRGEKFDKKVKVTAVCPAGVGHERLNHPVSTHNDCEQLFRLAWQDLHQGPMYGGSTRNDLLARLLDPRPEWGVFGIVGGVTKRDRVVAATVIQWLGTNVGRGFLREVLMEDARSYRFMQAIEEAMYGRHTKPRLVGGKASRLIEIEGVDR